MSDLKTNPDLLDKAERLPDFTEIMGTFIDENIIMKRNVDQGGCTMEILGPQGSGKTSLMLNYACRIMEENPDEIIIWKDSYQAICQFNRLNNWNVFAQNGVNLEFNDVYNHKKLDIDITYFDVYKNDFTDLLHKLEPQCMNAVFVKNETVDYIKLINFLSRYKGWQSIFIDEYKDIAPLNASGIKNQLIGQLGNEMSRVRKGLVSLFCNTQSKSQIDWRVRSSHMVVAYLAGAKRDSTTNIYQNAINALVKGSAWLSWEGKFGMINYPAFKPKPPIIDVEDLNRKSELDIILEQME